MSTKKRSSRPSWLPNWTDGDAYAIERFRGKPHPFSLLIIAFDFLRRNPDYIRDYSAFKALTVSKQTEDARALCDKYAIADGWPPDPAIDPRSDKQPLPLYRHSFYPRLITRLPGAPDVAEIWTAPGDMLVIFSSHLPLDKQLKAASAWLRERLNKAQSDDRPKMHREVDRLVIDLRLLDARLNGAKWDEILELLFPDSPDLSTARKAHDRAVEIRDRLYQFLPEPKGSWGP
jgi:hypothetical protein